MKIIRWGDRRNHGEKEVELKKVTASWSAEKNSLIIESSQSEINFEGESYHYYKIEVEMKELLSMIKNLPKS